MRLFPSAAAIFTVLATTTFLAGCGPGRDGLATLLSGDGLPVKPPSSGLCLPPGSGASVPALSGPSVAPVAPGVGSGIPTGRPSAIGGTSAGRSKFLGGMQALAGGLLLDPASNLRVTQSVPFPAAQEEEIAAHPLSRLSASKLDGGSQLIFVVFYYSGPILGGMYRSATCQQAAVGMSVQAEFVARTLQKVFPKALVTNQESLDSLTEKPELKKRRVIILYPADFAEVYPTVGGSELLAWSENLSAGNYQPLDAPVSPVTTLKNIEDHLANMRRYPYKPLVIEMSQIKAANATALALSKAEARHVLSIDEKSKVVHIYGQFKTENVANLVRLMRRAETEMKPDVLILSGKKWLHGEDPAAFASSFPKRKMILLSQLKPGELSGKGKWLLINDSFGLMNALNLVSDHLVVVGAANPLEGLNVGTPTTVILNAGDFVNYNRDVYLAAYENVMEGTGGATVINLKGDSVVPPVKLPLVAPGRDVVRLRPFQVVASDGSTPTKRFLDSLQRVLATQLTATTGGKTRRKK